MPSVRPTKEIFVAAGETNRQSRRHDPSGRNPAFEALKKVVQRSVQCRLNGCLREAAGEMKAIRIGRKIVDLSRGVTRAAVFPKRQPFFLQCSKTFPKIFYFRRRNFWLTMDCIYQFLIPCQLKNQMCEFDSVSKICAHVGDRRNV